MQPVRLIAFTSIALSTSMLKLMASEFIFEVERNETDATITCMYFDGGEKTRTMDLSWQFDGDLCCGRYDAFGMAERLLDEGESVVVGRIEDAKELPETLLVRRDVAATVEVQEVFRHTAKEPAPRIQVRLSSDMFLWPETQQARIVARQGLINEHERKRDSLVARGRSLDEELASGILDEDSYRTEISLLEAEYLRIGNLRWEWDGEKNSRVRRTRADPFPNCDNGRFTLDRGGALEVGGTYLFALDEVANNGGIEYRLHDMDYDAKWNVFEGEEMDDIVHALTLTNACLNWPELVFDEENGFVMINICATWARGVTRPNQVRHRR